METALKFFMFYSTFIMVVVYLSTLAGVSIFSDEISTLIPASASDLLNPLWVFGSAWTLFTMTTEYQVLYTVLLVPFFVGLTYISVVLLRGGGI